MKIIVHHTWYRGPYDKDNISSAVILEAEKSKKGVTQAVREWVKGWTGKGYVLVSSIETTYADDKKYCEIAQKKFNFNNA
jgi:hypothetical protein